MFCAIKSKFQQLLIILASLNCILYSVDSNAQNGGTCIAANDFGLGGILYVVANPDEGLTSGSTRLLREIPRKQQIAPWIDTGLYTLGNPPDPNNPELSNLRITLNGQWNPWGDIEGVKLGDCNLVNCDPKEPLDRRCFPGGEVVERNLDNLPCILKNGWGLYGLIALSEAGRGYSDPNQLGNAINLPKEFFRTFRVAPTIKGSRINSSNPDEEPEYEYYFELGATEVCNETGCVKDIHRDGGEYVMRGRLFFKIQDNYYQDNTGGYNVTVTNGVYTEKGFIERTIHMFEEEINKVTTSLYNNIVKDLHLIGIVRSVLMLYVTVTGIMFMLGLIQIGQTELVIRLFKIGVVATLISEDSFKFFDEYLFVLCRDGARSVADMIIRATLYYDGNPNNPIYYIPDQASPLTIYDILLKMLVKLPVHAKTFSLLFYQWKLYWIPCIYICFYFIIISILKSLMIYLLMMIQFSLLLIMSPIFIVMLLFELTRELFDSWLKQLISTGFLYVMLTASIVLMFKLIFGKIEELLWFRVCWQTVWEFKILGLTIIDLKFWHPQASSELMRSVNATNFFSFLLLTFVFFAIMEKIPEIADMLIAAGREPSTQMYRAAMSQYQGSVVDSGVNLAKSGLNTGLEKVFSKIDGGRTAKAIKVARGTVGKLNKIFNKAEKKITSGGIEKMPIKDAKDWIGKADNKKDKK